MNTANLIRKLSPVLLCALVIGIATILIRQQQSLARLRAENELLRSQAKASSQSEAVKMAISPQAATTNGPYSQVPAISNELLNLRREVALLQRQNAQLRGQLNPLLPLGAEKQVRQISALRMDAMGQLIAATRQFLLANNDGFPSNFTQFRDLVPKELPRKNQIGRI